MLGYRTIGTTELYTLVECKNPIYGQDRYQDRPECGCDYRYPYGIVCFFAEPILIKNKDHKIQIVVDVGDNPMSGIGEYLVSKEFDKTKTFTYRGKQKVKLQEYYLRNYSIKDVKSINIAGNFAWWFYEDLQRKLAHTNVKVFNNRNYLFPPYCPIEMPEAVKKFLNK